MGFGAKRDPQFEMMIEAALRHDKPVRIGVNWGSLDEDLSTRMMDENARLAEPRSADEVLRERWWSRRWRARAAPKSSASGPTAS